MEERRMNRDDQSVDEEAPTQVYARAPRPPAAVRSPEQNRAGLWDSNDVARYLKVSRSWVYHRAEAGLLPCVRIGSLLLFDPDVIAGVARGERSPMPGTVTPIIAGASPERPYSASSRRSKEKR
jgi:hypothetical protein